MGTNSRFKIIIYFSDLNEILKNHKDFGGVKHLFIVPKMFQECTSLLYTHKQLYVATYAFTLKVFPSKSFMAHCRAVERVWVLVSPEQVLVCNFIAVELIMISSR